MVVVPVPGALTGVAETVNLRRRRVRVPDRRREAAVRLDDRRREHAAVHGRRGVQRLLRGQVHDQRGVLRPAGDHCDHRQVMCDCVSHVCNFIFFSSRFGKREALSELCV